MIPHDILTLYSAKMLEYGIAVLFLVLFIPFWRYVHGGKAARARVAVRAPARSAEPRGILGWFQVPENVHLHPDHSWARMEEDGAVTVGIDEFGNKPVFQQLVRLSVVRDGKGGKDRIAIVRPEFRARIAAAVFSLSPVIIMTLMPASRQRCQERSSGASSSRGWIHGVTR